jgi:ABC-type dipeptide/oligopeptide/nickel transport system permease subunit
VFIGSWSPPSPLHPLGQSGFGRDVLAQVAYGTRNSIIFGLGAVVIGLIGGLIFGPLASKFNRVGHTITMSVMLIFYVLPGILLVMFLTAILGFTFGLLMSATGFLLIPSFTRIIANTEFRPIPILKKIIAYLPLFAGFAILFYLSLGFLGIYDYHTINLGGLVNSGRSHMYDAPWASFWPGGIAFLIVVSLFVLHEGLAKSSR